MDDWPPVLETEDWQVVAPVAVAWTLLTPGSSGGQLDFSDPDNSDLLPGI